MYHTKRAQARYQCALAFDADPLKANALNRRACFVHRSVPHSVGATLALAATSGKPLLPLICNRPLNFASLLHRSGYVSCHGFYQRRSFLTAFAHLKTTPLSCVVRLASSLHGRGLSLLHRSLPQNAKANCFPFLTLAQLAYGSTFHSNSFLPAELLVHSFSFHCTHGRDLLLKVAIPSVFQHWLKAVFHFLILLIIHPSNEVLWF